MSIPQSKYVAITSGLAQTESVGRKALIPRVLTTNPLFAVNTVYEFTSSADVADFAGALSAEAKLASEYFSWISKTATQAKKISFMRYSFEALAPSLYSTKKTITPLAAFKAVTNGSMVVNLGGTSFSVSNVNLSSATSYADVASAVQTAVKANTSGGQMWTAATVTFNAANSSFVLKGGETGKNTINYAEASTSGTDLSSLLGWNIANAPVLSDGQDEQTVTDILNKCIDISTNFLTFGFLNASDCYDNLDEIGTWAGEQNFNYRLCFDLGASNYAEGMATAAKYAGLTAHYNVNYGITGINPAWIMSAILPATTEYNKPNSVKNYMFQQFPQQPVSVGINDGSLYQTLDNLLVNYNGQTQKSGVTVAFYQNGFNSDGTDTAIFDNEAWLKDAISTDILNAFLGLDFISADSDGKTILTGILENNCDEAVTNHVFGKPKILSSAQKAYITQVTGDDQAYLDVQNNAYHFDVDITTEQQGNTTIYVGKYTLIYLKNDVIRKVEGRNILI